MALLWLIWAALFFLLNVVLRQISGWGLVVTVADEHLFVHFFLVLAIMLAFSNAILTFTSLYGKDEAGHLLSMPLRARHVVLVKWFEGILLSSWSFMLLGIPLMLAVANNAEVPWTYYPLFLGHFFGFVAIPACIGLLAAWGVAMWAPRRPISLAISIGFLILLVAVYWLSSISRDAFESNDRWLRTILEHIGKAKQPLLPSTWTAKGISYAMAGQVRDSLFYMGVVAGNAIFLSWLTVNLLGRTWPVAFSRAQQGRMQPVIRRGWVTEAWCWALFFYLPKPLRLVMLKDLRGFARDAKQWSQMLIMFGLLVIYVLNLQNLPVDINSAFTKGLVVFLNLTTVSLILATFTSRFIYPLLSLESQQLWLIELLPLRRMTLLMVKFLFALMVTGSSGGLVMWLAVRVLGLSTVWAGVNLALCLSVCVGLSGLSIGLGARFPVMGQRNPARIASGFGGTFNLIASMLFVTVEMLGVGWLSVLEFGPAFVVPETLSMRGAWLVCGLLALGVVVAVGSMWIGARHFKRLEY